MVNKKSKLERYDLVIVGGGGTGLAAAMYGARLGLKTCVFGYTYGSELPIGGVITTTNIVENYPGFINLTGPELGKKLEEHAKSYELVSIKEEKVENVMKKSNCFKLETNKGNYEGKTVLFATGTKWKKLPKSVKGAEKFEKKGIQYCALCDAPLYKNKVVCIIGGSDSAAKDALVLAEHAKKVYIIYRGVKIHPEPINLKRVNSNKKIEIINNTNITEIKGENFVESIILDKAFKGSKELKVSAVFVAIGHVVLSEIAKKLNVNTNKSGEIIINHKTSETNVKGVFAAGDVTDGEFKQLITGVAEGCIASYFAYEFITKNIVETC